MCKLHYCCKPTITIDGYCFKHKHYSMENRFVIEHIEKFLRNIKKAPTHQEKVQQAILLFNYLKYKKEFIIKYPKFKKTVEKKMIEIINDINNNLSDKIDIKIKIKAYKTFQTYQLNLLNNYK